MTSQVFAVDGIECLKYRAWFLTKVKKYEIGPEGLYTFLEIINF